MNWSVLKLDGRIWVVSELVWIVHVTSAPKGICMSPIRGRLANGKDLAKNSESVGAIKKMELTTESRKQKAGKRAICRIACLFLRDSPKCSDHRPKKRARKWYRPSTFTGPVATTLYLLVWLWPMKHPVSSTWDMAEEIPWLALSAQRGHLRMGHILSFCFTVPQFVLEIKMPYSVGGITTSPHRFWSHWN